MRTLEPLMKNIKEMRGLTWEQMAEAVGMVTPNFLAAIKRPLLSETQEKILQAFGYSGDLVPLEEATEW